MQRWSQVLKTSFTLTIFVQCIAALFLFVGQKDWLFRYQAMSGELQNFIHYQVDTDALSVTMLFLLPAAFFFIVLSVLFFLNYGKMLGKNSVYYKINVLFGAIEILVWIYRLFEMIHFSQSLVSCDVFVLGKHLGCYIPWKKMALLDALGHSTKNFMTTAIS